MKIFTHAFILFAIITTGARAQTLNESAFPVAGDVFTMTLGDTTGFNTGATGTNVTWNYGSLTSTGGTRVDSFMSPASTPYAGVVTNATVAMHRILPASSQFIYFRDNSSTSSFQRVANIIPDTVIYSTPGNEFSYPASYGSTENGTYYAQYHSHGSTEIEAGVVSGSFDAAGTLTNPFGTYTNVIRAHATRNENDTVSNGAATGTSVYEYYDWYQANSYYPIMEYATSSVVIGGHVLFSSVSVTYRQGYASSAVDDMNQDNTGWVVFPNPASQKATVVFQAATNGKTEIILHDMSGREIQHLYDENAAGSTQSFTLNLGDVTPGIYTVSIKNENGLATRKLEIVK